MNDLLYDLSQLEEISKGNQQFINKMIQLFVEQSTISVAEIKSAFESKDYNKVQSVAHRFKTSIDFMGISDLKDTIRFIENNAVLLKSSKQLADHITKLDVGINNVVESLSAKKIN